jgi:hypothetical protein
MCWTPPPPATLATPRRDIVEAANPPSVFANEPAAPLEQVCTRDGPSHGDRQRPGFREAQEGAAVPQDNPRKALALGLTRAWLRFFESGPRRWLVFSSSQIPPRPASSEFLSHSIPRACRFRAIERCRPAILCRRAKRVNRLSSPVPFKLKT